ncbi:MAG TPA: adenylate/guanylate cyclase domain-containing protein [Bradyrhizobium sp.]|jgi:adenylate cyclase|nr:adenylate/guanylate cyclase domain-containing protein [Bradyrhizobium sp.]
MDWAEFQSRGRFLNSERVERRLAAVLAADVAGYSRLMGVDEEGTLARLKAARKSLVDPTIASHRGRIVKTTGDGMLVEFASAVDAIRGAVEVQRSMAEQNASVPQDQRIEFRIGIHVGDIIIDDNDIFGDGVNVAARLEGIAEAGGICISDDAQRQVRGKVDIAFEDMGSQTLKNIAEPMRAWRVRPQGQAPSVAQSSPAASTKASSEIAQPLALPDKPSIAVLPFQNMSGDPEQEYFAEGIVEDIITGLSQSKSLFVIARNSSFTYKGKAFDIKQVGRELGVRYVLEGSVRRAGGRLRITAQLIEAAQNKHLWAEKLDGDVNDIFALQDALTMKIVSSVSNRLEQMEIDKARCKPTTLLDAYDLYLKGLALVRYDRRFDEAHDLFTKAFALDPDYAAAYAMAALCLLYRQSLRGSSLSPDDSAESIRLARMAAKLAQEDANAMARAAHVLANLGKQYDLAKELVDRAVALNPNLGSAWLVRGWVSIMRGEGQCALESFTTVLRLDPLDPARAGAWAGLACAHNALGDFEAGYQWATRALETETEMYTLAYFVINAVPAGRMQEARDAVRKMLQLKPAVNLSDACQLCCTRDEDWSARMMDSFRKAGLSE